MLVEKILMRRHSQDTAYQESLEMDRMRELSKQQAEDEARSAEARAIADSQAVAKVSCPSEYLLPIYLHSPRSTHLGLSVDKFLRGSEGVLSMVSLVFP